MPARSCLVRLMVIRVQFGILCLFSMLRVLRASVGRIHMPGCHTWENVAFLFSDIARVASYILHRTFACVPHAPWESCSSKPGTCSALQFA